MSAGEKYETKSGVKAYEVEPMAEDNLNTRLSTPRIAEPTNLTAPVHLDVGGVYYTTTLATLTK